MSPFMTDTTLQKFTEIRKKFFNLNYLLSGSEGTLAVVSKAKNSFDSVRNTKVYLLLNTKLLMMHLVMRNAA
ncbi:MAG: hypothetical protein Ct9H300mP21_02220 [Pseudomonadota bacterium]|nr:MAG: hypothetical protein Ct9H300mP21_02220 [Pseudomonadota bacterium]